MSYVALDDLSLYYEIHGSGDPLVLLPGGMNTIELSFAELLPRLAADRQVIAVEPQGHGHTGDAERPFSLEAVAGDVVGLLDHLGIARADVLGFSLGGMAALETAVRHAERVDRLVLISMHTRADGFHEEIRNPDLWATSTRMPNADDFTAMRDAYARLSPTGTTFEDMNAKVQPIVTAEETWTPEQLAGVSVPTLVMVGDHDFVTVEHAEYEHRSIPGSQLAVVPGAKHDLTARAAEVITPILERFLRRS